LKNATVFADANGDGIQNADEVSVATDAQGGFTLVNAKGAIVVSGGTDLSTGKDFKGTLKAPAGSAVITPLTTLQQGFIEAGQSASQAQQSVANALGFDSRKVDLSTYDPIATLVTSSAQSSSAVDSALATQLMASSAQIANFLVTAGQVLQGAAGGSDQLSTQTAGSVLLKSLVTAIKVDAAGGDGRINLADTVLLKTVLVDSAREAVKSNAALGGVAVNFAEKVDKLSDTVATVLTSAAETINAAVIQGGDVVSLLSHMDKVTAFTQGEAGEALKKTAEVLDTKNASALTSMLNEQKAALTGEAAAKAIENQIVATKVIAEVIVSDKAIADAKAISDAKAIADASDC
jgi:hypothetical protein